MIVEIFKTVNGSILHYDIECQKLITKDEANKEDIMTSLQKDAKSVSPVDRICAEDLLAEIEKYGIKTVL